MFRWAAILGLIGLAVATGVIVWSGIDQVLLALAQAGWGIPLVAAYHFIPIVVSSAGWRVLVPGKNKLSLRTFIYFMWVRAAINNLMPVARIGGEIASVRLMTARGMRKNVAIAITISELTLSIAAIFTFIAIGIFLFALRINDQNVVRQLVWGFVVSTPIFIGLAFVQKIGFFGLLSRLFRVAFRDKWKDLAGSAARLDRAVTIIYRRKGRALECALWQFVAWVLGAFEVWLGLTFLGHPLPLIEAVMLEALIQGTIVAGFAIPAALGVQEAGYLVFGGMLGLPHEIAAALAIIRRCRDLICYVPALIAWQVDEGRKLLKS